MKNKILIGLVLGAMISPCLLSGGNIAPAWVEEHRAHNPNHYKQFEYQGVLNTKEEDRRYSYTETEYISHGQYSSSIYNLTDGHDPYKKIVIKQKIPCYVAVKGWDKARSLVPAKFHPKPVQRKHCKAVYKGNGVTEIYKWGVDGSGGTQTTRIGKNIRVFDSKKATPSTAELIAGDSFSCLDKPNSETWTVYWFLKGQWVAMAKEKMGKTSQNLRKPEYKSKKQVIKKSHTLDKTTNDKKQETRIRIYKYGAPDGFGKTFNSASDCEAERVKLTESHKGLDYEYKCEKK